MIYQIRSNLLKAIFQRNVEKIENNELEVLKKIIYILV